MRSYRRFFLSLTLALPLSAGTIYVSEGTNLYTVDTSTANTLNTIALSAAFNPLSLVQDPLNGLLYANDSSGNLDTIDPATGNVTSVATIGPGSATSGQLAFNAAGALYFFSSALSGGSGSTFVYSVDAATGALGNSSGSTASSSGFAYNFATGIFETLATAGSSPATVNSIDPASGAESILFSATRNFLPIPNVLAIDPAGTLFGVCGLGSSFPFPAIDCTHSTPNLISIDPAGNTSGLGVLAGNSADVIASVVSFSPEPSAVVLLLSGIAGLFAMRKKIF